MRCVKRVVFSFSDVVGACYPLALTGGSSEVPYVVAAFAVTSSLYFLLAAFAAIRAGRALRSRTAVGPRPAVSLLIPLCGAEPRLRANLDAALQALGPEDEFVVGAASPEDPALEVARGLADPRVRIVAGS